MASPRMSVSTDQINFFIDSVHRCIWISDVRDWLRYKNGISFNLFSLTLVYSVSPFVHIIAWRIEGIPLPRKKDQHELCNTNYWTTMGYRIMLIPQWIAFGVVHISFSLFILFLKINLKLFDTNV